MNSRDSWFRSQPRVSAVTLHWKAGSATVTSAQPLQRPSALGVLDLLYAAVAVVATSMPRSSAMAGSRALRYWGEFRTAFHAPTSPWSVAAYLLLRVAPPFNVPLPEWTKNIVAPATASGEASAMKRHLRNLALGPPLLADDQALLDALGSDLVRRVRASLGANITRAKTKKLPILWHMVSEAIDRLCGHRLSELSDLHLRALAIACCNLGGGLRRSEGVALNAEHLVSTSDGFTVIILKDKTNQCAGPHVEPRSLPITQPLAVQVLRLYVSRFATRLVPGAPLFFDLSARTGGQRLSPGTVNSAIRMLFPGAGVVPHSCRVGFATELRASGTSIEMIMEMGRWTSLRALLYILPSSDQMAAASFSMGSGNLRFDSFVFQQSIHNRALEVRRAALPVIVPAAGAPAVLAANPGAQIADAADSPVTSATAPPSPCHRLILPPPHVGAPPGSLRDLPAASLDRLRAHASRGTSPWLTTNCWRCPAVIPGDDGWFCDYNSPDGVPCRNGICDSCWPYGSKYALFCRDHRKTAHARRLRPRNHGIWSDSSDPELPDSDSETKQTDRWKRVREHGRRQDERDVEIAGRILLGQSSSSAAASSSTRGGNEGATTRGPR